MTNNLFQVIDNKIKYELNQVHTALPAKVVSFNGHTVTIELMINKVLSNGEVIELPPLVDVIAQFPRAGGFCFTVPIKKGDEGLAIFSEACIDGWYQSSNKSIPLDNRQHDLSDAFFIVGTPSLANKIPDFYNEGASIQTDDGKTYIRLTDGKILIKGDIEHEGDTKQTGDTTLNGKLTQSGGINTFSGNIVADAGITVNVGLVLNGAISGSAGISSNGGVLTVNDVSIGGINLKSHKHGGVQNGSSSTSEMK